jgi:membrane-bound metal-dependent hydrolase YbcI (DUF457 family)
MSPPGHAAVSYLLGRAVPWLSLPAVLVGGVLPDVDFVLLPFSWFNRIHRVATHNLWFVLAVAIVGLAFAKNGRRSPVFLGLLIGGLLHLLVDSCMDSNPTNGLGVALFWPLSDAFYSPFNLVSINNDGTNWSDPLAMGWRFLKQGLIWELPIYTLALWLWWQRHRERVRRNEPRTRNLRDSKNDLS